MCFSVESLSYVKYVLLIKLLILQFTYKFTFNHDLIYFLFFSDYKDGFGGQFGVQADRVDKSALGWEHHEKLNKHESQKDYAKGKE